MAKPTQNSIFKTREI